MKKFKIENISQPLSINASASRLYLTGGYHSDPVGCRMWGSSKDHENRFIGDDMGSIKLTYADGDVDEIPLIMGITLWFHGEVWAEKCAPFKSENEAENDPELISALKQALQLYGAFEDAENTDSDYDYLMYLNIIKLIEEQKAEYAAKIFDSVRIKNVLFRLHINAKLSVSALNFERAKELLLNALDGENGEPDPILKYRLLCDLEQVCKALSDYETAYNASIQKGEMYAELTK